jgi:hypothetical protein
MPLAWFDAGYFTPRLDGNPWVQKAIRLGGIDMEYALSLMTEFRLADLKPAGAVIVAR